MDPGLKIAGVTTRDDKGIQELHIKDAFPSYVMPEIFNQASTSSVIPEIFYRESMFLNNLDPGLKIAGVTTWDDRNVQE